MTDDGRAGAEVTISRPRFTLLRRAAVSVAVAAILILAPSAAYAAFTGSSQSQLNVSAAKLVAPDAAATKVNTSCEVGDYWGSVNIIVTSYGTVPWANYYELKVLDPRGDLAFTGGLSSALGKHFSFLGRSSNLRGTWTDEIRGYYKVPGSNNAWTGTPLVGKIVCS